MGIRAIPTMYDGVRFRSRLEAHWAAMFDAVGWTWEYEPLDFNGYITGFLIKFDEEPIYVEVKPETTFEGLSKHHIKADEAGCPNLLVVGAFPFRKGHRWLIGDMVPSYQRREPKLTGYAFAVATRFSTDDEGIRCDGYNLETLVCTKSRLSAIMRKHLRDEDAFTAGFVEDAWKWSKNRVQWKGRK